MKKLVVILLLLLCSPAWSVELLVQAHREWRKDKPTTGWTEKDFMEMWRQTHRGEVIAIHPNGVEWGTKESPPFFVVIKIPAVTVAQAAQYLEPLVDTMSVVDTAVVQADSVDVKQRGYHFTMMVVDSALALWSADSSYVVLTPTQAKSVIQQYDITAVKQKIRSGLKE